MENIDYCEKCTCLKELEFYNKALFQENNHKQWKKIKHCNIPKTIEKLKRLEGTKNRCSNCTK
jgi:hypothetical protein